MGARRNVAADEKTLRSPLTTAPDLALTGDKAPNSAPTPLAGFYTTWVASRHSRKFLARTARHPVILCDHQERDLGRQAAKTYSADDEEYDGEVRDGGARPTAGQSSYRSTRVGGNSAGPFTRFDARVWKTPTVLRWNASEHPAR